MADEPVERILDAAYACFARHGVRRTTMDDIAAAAEMSRPAVYQYVRNKDDVFRRLATRLFDSALAQAQQAAASDRPLPERVQGVLAAKLDLTLKLWHDSPHAPEMLDAGTRLSGDLVEQFATAIHELLTTTITQADTAGRIDLAGTDAGALADVAIALTYGLEQDLDDPRRPHQRLHLGVGLLLASLTPS